MKPVLIYLAQSGLCLAVFFLTYELFLKRETFFQLNRIFLVLGLWISLLVPAFPVTSPFWTLTVPASTGFSPLPVSSGSGFGLTEILVAVYGIGVFFFLLRFGLQLAKLRRVVRTYGMRRLRGVKIVAVERLFSPFSFFDLIFLNPGPSLDANLRRILAHEQVHIRQQHTLDVLLMEVVLSFQWFNPFVWPYKKALQETHEYLADSGVIAQGFSSVRYQLHMFEQNVGASFFEFGNNFKKSQIKRRIIMLSQMKSPGVARLKLLLALPLLAGLVLAFAQPRLVAGSPAAPDQVQAADSSHEKKLQVKEELKKLEAMEADVRKQMETTSDEGAKKELKMKLEKIAQMQKELSMKNGASSELSPAERKAMALELKEKEAAIKAAYEKSSDENEKAKLKEQLAKLHQKSMAVTPSGFSTDEMKKMLVELKAKESDLKTMLGETSDPEKKVEIEKKLKQIQAKTTEMMAEYEKALAAGKAKAEKTVK